MCYSLVQVDESQGCEDQERLSRLEVENKALREMLEICTTSKDRIVMPFDSELKDGSQASKDEEKDRTDAKNNDGEDDEEDDDDDTTDTESDNTVLEVLPSSKPVAEQGAKAQAPSAVKEEKKDGKKEVVSTDVKKKSSATDVGKGEPATKEGSVERGKKTPGTSKSAGDVRKGKSGILSSSLSSSPVKRTTSATTVRNQTMKKSPSVETKKDLKTKSTAKSGAKK